MADIIKTIESWRDPRRVLRFLTNHNGCEHDWAFFFSLGRAKPKQPVERLFFTFQGRILGWFDVLDIIYNSPQFEASVSGGTTLDQATTPDQPPRQLVRYRERNGGEWRPKMDSALVLCRPPFFRVEEKLYHEGFRGWRYFDLEAHRKTLDAQVRV